MVITKRKPEKTLLGIQYIQNFRNIDYLEEDDDGNQVERFGLFTEYRTYLVKEPIQIDGFFRETVDINGISTDNGKTSRLSLMSPSTARSKDLIDDNEFKRARNQDNLVLINRDEHKLIGFTRMDDITCIRM